jgi:hypothetical protein
MINHSCVGDTIDPREKLSLVLSTKMTDTLEGFHIGLSDDILGLFVISCAMVDKTIDLFVAHIIELTKCTEVSMMDF